MYITFNILMIAERKKYEHNFRNDSWQSCKIVSKLEDALENIETMHF